MSHENSDPLLSEGFGQLVNLEELNLQDCRQLLALSADFGGLKSLKVLNLSSSDYYYTMSLRSLPEGIGQLVNLKELNMGGCENLLSLPAGFVQRIITFKTLIS